MNRFTREIFSALIPAFIFLIVIPTFCYAGEIRSNSVNKNNVRKKAFYLSINNGLVSLDAKGADVRRVLEDISKQSDVEITIGPHVGGTISVSFRAIPLEEALKKITLNRGIVFSKEKGDDKYHVSRVMIAASSPNTDNVKMRIHNPVHASAPEYPKPSSTAIKASPPGRPRTSIRITDQNTGIQSEAVSNELIIRFKKGVSKEDKQALIAKTGATIRTHIAALDYYVISLPSSLAVSDALDWFMKHGIVEKAEPNYMIPIEEVPNDTDFPLQWGLHNANDADIDAVEAWNIEKGIAEVVIAIVDTGVFYTHPDLEANIWHNPGEVPDNGLDDDANGYIDDTIGWDFVDASGGAEDEDYVTPDNDPMDRHGHGTHVAGIAGAVTDNELGIAGVAWNCTIMPVRAGYKRRSGDGVLESDDAAQAIIYAAENGASVINLSWGSYQKSNLIEDAMTFATNKAALVCAAAGNRNSTSPIYPAGYENSAVLAVGATDDTDQKADFSNYGDWVHVSAPGVDIYSTCLNNYDPPYCQMSGTSMAAPHVAGLAGLLFSHFPYLSPLEVKNRIMRSVDVLEALIGKNLTSGRINGYSALADEYITPKIFSLNPNAAHEGDRISLFGDGFGSEKGSSYVTFHPGIEAGIISWSDSTIVCRVPYGAQTGQVRVTTSEGISNGLALTMLIKFYDETLIENQFSEGGEAQGWKEDDDSWQYRLPFSFPFFTGVYESVYVCSNGFLDFTNSSSSYLNTQDALRARVMIAPMWDDLRTNGSSQQGEDIYIHSPSPDSICFRWAGERHETGDPINVEVVLYKDGRIKFNYGSGNTNLSPTIGISNGDGDQYQLALCDGESWLHMFQTVLFTPKEGLFTIPPDFPTTTSGSGGSGGGGACFIATAAFGSPYEGHVKILRQFRDEFLLTTKGGQIFISGYYKYSSSVADFIASHDIARLVVRWGLLPLVGVSWIALKLGPGGCLALMALLLSIMCARFIKKHTAWQ